MLPYAQRNWVSPGVAVGTAYCIHEIFVNPTTRRLAADEMLPELTRYEQARDAAADDLRALYAKVASQVGRHEAAIFMAHESILRDPAFTEKIRHWIADERQTAPYALNQVLQEYSSLFARTKDSLHSRPAGRSARRDVPHQWALVRSAPSGNQGAARADDPGGRRIAPVARRYPRQARSGRASPRRPAGRPAMPPFWPAAAAFRRCPACGPAASR